MHGVTKKKERILYENFLPEDQFENLRSVVTHQNFPWQHRVGAVVEDGDGDVAWSNVIVNNYGPTTEDFKYFTPILDKVNAIACIRIKCNLDLKVHEMLVPTGFHTDTEVHGNGLWSMCIYLDDSNGATIFEKDKAPVRSKRNRAIIFPSGLSHSGARQTDTDTRFVINVNFVSHKLPEGGKKF